MIPYILYILYVYTVCIYTVCIYTLYVYTVCIYILYGAGTEHKTHLLRLEESTNQNPTFYHNQHAQKMAITTYGHFAHFT